MSKTPSSIWPDSDAFTKFAKNVIGRSRYAWNKETKDFLDVLIQVIETRIVIIPKGYTSFRAQIGVDFDENGLEMGYSAQRMKPNAEFVRDGRANSAGIPVLYLATTAKTAISEVRPWLDEKISLAQFETNKELKFVDFTINYKKNKISNKIKHILAGTKPTTDESYQDVWCDLDNAFSKPVSQRDKLYDYIPTQIVSEVLKINNIDGLIYKSNFDFIGYNIAIFDLSSADIINCVPYKVNSIDIISVQSGNYWFKKKQ